ncbi:MAG TPA: MaoC family dehydratase [Mesorhizobium sp.]|jgi:acyl dehydratase|nr:MaoC family dehydratase [Mesorhizobium sp.]
MSEPQSGASRRDGFNPALVPVTLDELQAAVGQEVGVSPWRQVTQAMIDGFADATDDHQFIHVDPARAAAETPFGGTIAHGFLTLSLLSAMFFETIRPLKGDRLGVNQGFDQVRFLSPVKSGARIRARFKLAEVKARPSGWVNVAHDVTVEIEGGGKPALTARWLTLSGPPGQGAV